MRALGELVPALARRVDRAGVDEVGSFPPEAMLSPRLARRTALAFDLVDLLLVAVAEEADARAGEVLLRRNAAFSSDQAPASPCTAARRARRRAPAPRPLRARGRAAARRDNGDARRGAYRRVRRREYSALFEQRRKSRRPRPIRSWLPAMVTAQRSAHHLHAFVGIGVVADDVAEAHDALARLGARAPRSAAGSASRLPWMSARTP